MAKVEFPKQGISLALPCFPRVVLNADFERYATGSMFMTMNESAVNINGVLAGTISQQAMGSGSVVRIGQRTWSISAEELWKLAAAADEEYMKDADARARAAEFTERKEVENDEG